MTNRKIYNIFTPSYATKPLDLYIIKNNRPFELYINIINNVIYLYLDRENMLEYNEHLDGIPLDKDEASKLYPEYFI